ARLPRPGGTDPAARTTVRAPLRVRPRPADGGREELRRRGARQALPDGRAHLRDGRRRAAPVPGGARRDVTPPAKGQVEGSRSRFKSSALTATMTLEPDIDRAAISGRSTRPNAGSNTPAAMGRAIEL